MGLFSKKPEPKPRTPEERLWDAMDEFNAAWVDYEKTVVDRKDRVRPWINWPDRELVLTKVSGFFLADDPRESEVVEEDEV